MTPVILHGDVLDVLPTLTDASVDAVVCDPPYALGFMGHAWDTHTPAGFQVWCQAWAADCLRVLKPGGHLLAFGGTRTVHRLTSGIEDAGFEIRDGIDWLYGSGFPKSLDVSKAIDKRGGNGHLAGEIATAIKTARKVRGWTTGQADRHFCNGSTNWTWFEGRKGDCRPPTPDTFARIAAEWPELLPLAQLIEEADREVVGQSAHKPGIANGTVGHYTVGGTFAAHVDITAPGTNAARRWAGWGTALKPAREPIVVARKPLTGTVAATVQQHGTGAINIDACRVPAVDAAAYAGNASGDRGHADRRPDRTGGSANTGGRWPTNVIMSHAGDDDTGDACADGCVPGCAVAALDAQSGITRSGEHRPHHRRTAPGGNGATHGVMAGVTGRSHADAGGASRFYPVFRYQAKAPARERPKVDGVSHSTVKPLDLMRWLVRLVTPSGGHVLDPFAGSGTTVEACLLEGFAVTAVEREATYLPLIDARIARVTGPTMQ